MGMVTSTPLDQVHLRLHIHAYSFSRSQKQHHCGLSSNASILAEMGSLSRCPFLRVDSRKGNREIALSKDSDLSTSFIMKTIPPYRWLYAILTIDSHLSTLSQQMLFIFLNPVATIFEKDLPPGLRVLHCIPPSSQIHSRRADLVLCDSSHCV